MPTRPRPERLRPPLPAHNALEVAHQTQLGALTDGVNARTAATIRALAARGELNPDQLAATLGPILRGAAGTAAGSGDAYLSRLLDEDVTGIGGDGLGQPVERARWWARRLNQAELDATAAAERARSAAIRDGQPSDVADDIARTTLDDTRTRRLTEIVSTDTTSHIRQAANEAVALRAAQSEAADTAIRFWLRRPVGETCGFCIAAALNPIYKLPVKPMHPGCDCTTRPVFDGEDIWPLVARYRDLYEADLEAIGPYENKRLHRSRLSHQRHELDPSTGGSGGRAGPPDDPTPDQSDRPELHAGVAPTSKIARTDAAVQQRVDHTMRLIDERHRAPVDMPEVPEITHDNPDLREADGGYFRTSTDAIEISLKPHATELDFAHEFGHYFDHQDIDDPGEFASEHAARAGTGPLAEWWRRVRATDHYRHLAGASSDPDYLQYPPVANHLQYLLRPRELWARAYAQWLAVRSGDTTLLDALRVGQRLERATSLSADRTRQVELTLQMQWADDDFEAVASAMDRILEGI